MVRLAWSDVKVSVAEFYSSSDAAGIRFYDAAANVIETHERMGAFKEP